MNTKLTVTVAVVVILAAFIDGGIYEPVRVGGFPMRMNRFTGRISPAFPVAKPAASESPSSDAGGWKRGKVEDPAQSPIVDQAWIGQGAAILCALVTIFFGVRIFRWVARIEVMWRRQVAGWMVLTMFVAGASVIWLAVEEVVHTAVR
jgi:hypothetical protein